MSTRSEVTVTDHRTEMDYEDICYLLGTENKSRKSAQKNYVEPSNADQLVVTGIGDLQETTHRGPDNIAVHNIRDSISERKSKVTWPKSTKEAE